MKKKNDWENEVDEIKAIEFGFKIFAIIIFISAIILLLKI